MRNILGVLLLAFVLTFLSCAPHYLSSNFDNQTFNHKIIAVLPFEMFFAGIWPEELSEEDILEIEMAESKAFQVSLINEILRSTKGGKKSIRVNVQDYRTTWDLLESAEVDIMSSWTMKPETLADILGVDAIVRSRIEKYRIMSDLESYGSEIAVQLLAGLTNGQIWPWVPYGSSISKEIYADYKILDGESGNVVWSFTYARGANWRLGANEIIDNTNRKAAKKFPYRD